MKFKILAFIILSATLSACVTLGKYKDPEIKVQGIELNSFKEGLIHLNVLVNITNPNSRDFEIDEVQYTLWLNDKTQGQQNFKEKSILKANTTSTVKVPVAVAVSDIMSGIQLLMQQKPIKYKVVGKVSSGLFTVPFEKTGDWQLKLPK